MAALSARSSELPLLSLHGNSCVAERHCPLTVWRLQKRPMAGNDVKHMQLCFTHAIIGVMPKMIQIRNVPDDLHRSLRIRAVQLGMSLSDYLLSELEQVAEKPTLPELLERLGTRDPVTIDNPPAEVIRRQRES
jgi:plasmid stability protein